MNPPNPQPLEVFTCPLQGTQLIEASAGTGKTWNICGLVLRLLLERGLGLQQVLVVTFTKAATAELRERVRARITETLARLRGGPAPAGDPFVDRLLHSLRSRHGLADADMAARLDLALQTFDEAAIFTIHAYCQRALSDAPFSAGLPLAQTELADDRALRQEVVQDFWRRHVAAGQLPAALVAHLLQRGDSPQRWGQLLARQLAKPLSRMIWPDALDAAPEAAADPADLHAALQAAHTAARHTWQTQRADIVRLVQGHLPHLHGNSYKPATVAQAEADWQQLLTHPQATPPVGDKHKLRLFSSAQLQPKKDRPPMPVHPFFDQAGHLLALHTAQQQQLQLARLRLLRQLLQEAPAQLRSLKRERRVLAFDDLLFNLHDRLHHGLHSGGQPGLAAALRARYPVALIDEFQDTDPLQFSIFQTLYAAPAAVAPAGQADTDAAPALFLVGDPKQAIYSFRHADLHTYLQARSQAAAQYSLDENQRSSAALLQGLNALFGVHPRAFMLPGLHYQPVRCGDKPRPAWQDTSGGQPPRAALQLWALPAGEDGQPLLKAAALQAAAQACAGEIARLLAAGQAGQVLHGAAPLAGGHVAVLVRSHRQGAVMRQALATLGVASVELSQSSVFHSADAEDLERVLCAVLEPGREALLRAALATPLLGFDATALDALAGDEAQQLALVGRFTDYRSLWLQRGVGLMLRSLLAQEGAAARLLARPDGERRLTNLLHLQEVLHQAAAEHAGPDGLLRWLQGQRQADSASAGSTADSAQLRLASDRHLVQIVTIHKSKGLEYPLVFCPFLWDGHPGAAPPKLDGLAYHDAQGRPVLDFRAPADIPDHKAILAQAALETSAEHLRLIYVALTRAVQRCTVVVGSYSRRVKGGGRSSTESLRSRLNWLVAGGGHAPEGWAQHKREAADIAAAWQAFAQAPAQQGAVALDTLPTGPWPPLPPAHADADRLAALAPPSPLPGAWWIGSYSSLTQGARHESAALDHDARVGPPAAEGSAAAFVAAPAQPPAIPPALADDDSDGDGDGDGDDDILRFPRGPEAGNCLHALFEAVDFTQPAGWPAAIEHVLRRQPPGAVPAALAPRLPAMLQRLLNDVLHTPLPGAGTLATVPGTRRLVELEFMLPAASLQASALAQALREHGLPAPGLSFTRLQGYLRGFIDLVFEQQGRYFVLDWKSNHLGDRPADYAAAPVARAMAAHGYELQALLYTVALHRHLARRLPGYHYEQHCGGALYLFVRGVRPHWTDAQGAPTGVHLLRPPLALVERLSALFQPRSGAGA